MTSDITPGIVLLVAVALIAAQVTRVVAPRGTPYLLSLALAVGGMLLGELVVYTIHHGGPMLGVLHPVADLLVVACVEVVGIVFWPQRRVSAA